MKHKREILLKEAPINKAITSMAVPAIIGMLVGAIYNIVDTLFVGMLNDTAALGATTVLFPVFQLISAVGLTFGMGTASVISRRLGEQNREAASRACSTAFFTTMGIAVLFTLSALVFIKPMLRLFGATETILLQARVYGSIIVAGSMFQMLNMNMNNMLRAEGAAKISGAAIALGAILNIILDPIYMFVFDMGLAGAAAATVSAQSISTVLLLSYYLRKKSIVRLSFRHFKPSADIYKQIMAIGIPTFLRQALSSFAIAMMTNAAAPFGDSAIAAIGITIRVIMMPMMVLFGFCQGFQPLAGYAWGAKDYLRVHRAVNYSVGWTTKFAVVFTAILFTGAGMIVSAFTEDPEVLQRGALSLRLGVVIMPFIEIQLIYSFLYQALGRGRPSMLLAVARQGLFFLPLVLVMPRLFGLTGVYLAQPIADALALLVSVILAARISGELKKLETAQPELTPV